MRFNSSQLFGPAVCPATKAALKALLIAYRLLITQVSQRCVCNTRHTIMERLCCWLLMIHDRVGESKFSLTQELIASRVGARRAGITVAAGMLQAMKAIEYRRGHCILSDVKCWSALFASATTSLRMSSVLPFPRNSATTHPFNRSPQKHKRRHGNGSDVYTGGSAVRTLPPTRRSSIISALNTPFLLWV